MHAQTVGSLVMDTLFFHDKAKRNHVLDYHIGDHFPLEHKEGAQLYAAIKSIPGGVFLSVAGPIMALFAVFATSGTGSRIGLFALGALLSFLGVWLFLKGLRALVHRREITIDSKRVSASRRWLTGTRRWETDLSTYSGVLQVEEHRTGRRQRRARGQRAASRSQRRSSYTLHKVILKHSSDSGRDVLLWKSRSGASHRQIAEVFAKLLNLPALSASAGSSTYHSRAVEDLDKSVGELYREGKVEARFEPSALGKNSRLTVNPIDDGFEFSMQHRASVFLGLILAALGTGLVYWYFGPGVTGGKGAVWMLPVIGALFALVGIFAIAYGLFGVSTLRVTTDSIRYWTRLGGWQLSDKSMDAHAIEEVIVKRVKKSRPKLTVIGDAESMAFGEQLKSEEREQLRACIIETIARKAA